MIGAGPTAHGARRSARDRVLVLVGLAVYGALAALGDPMTWPVRVAVAGGVLIVIVLAVRRGWHRPGSPGDRGDLSKAGPVPIIVWVVLLAVVAVIQLGHFFAEPRSIYPTLSSLFEQPLSFYPVRAAAFAVWAWLGWALVTR
ncbi:hypothetical protein [Dietzia sp. SYD-A1]|uniref:hypothetical protein n=1 Tax=Dietzia sp. SYD-A1 TaxID=2780141 RepID=UPI00189150FD|nr:hypothetical protein [Dietzia sp. SYD-A1]